MGNDHQPPITTNELHHQPPSTTTGNIPQTPSPITPTTNTIEANSTPEQRLAAAIGQAILNISATSFQDAATTSPYILHTTSDAVNQDPLFTTNTTPPKNPTSSPPLRRAVSDAITTNYKPKKTTTKKPLRRALSDTRDYQQHKKTKTPESSTKKSSPTSEKLRKFEELFKKIEQIRRQEEEEEEEAVEDENPNPNPNPPQPQPKPKDEEEERRDECVAVERVTNGVLKFDLSCCCGKHFEMLIKQNGYCFYRLT